MQIVQKYSFTSLAGKVSTIIVIDGHIESLSLIADLVPASGNLY